jgi:hypothetical protein
METLTLMRKITTIRGQRVRWSIIVSSTERRSGVFPAGARIFRP